MLFRSTEIIRNTSHTIQKGVEAARSMETSLMEIAENSSRFSEITDNLEQVIVEQKAAAENVKSDLESVDRIAESNAETARQTNDACEDFTKQAQMLTELVSHVKIRNA